MNYKKNGPQYLSAQGGFTRERPDWMPPKGLQAPDLSELLPEEAHSALPTPRRSLRSEIRMPNPKPFKTPHITEAAAQRIAQALHVMLSEERKRSR